MKIVERENATETLAAYTAEIRSGPVVVTDHGKPVAILLLIENVDLETLGLSTNHQFIDLIERSRSRVRAEGGISSEEMRRRLS